MASIDERVVSMAFDNAKFEAGIAQTLASLAKLNDTLAKVGAVNGLQNIEASANKVTLTAPMSAMDKLRQKFGLGVDTKSITDIESAGEKVTLSGPQRAFEKLRSVIGGGIGDASKTFTDIEKASSRVSLEGASRAVDGLTAKFGALQVAGVTALATVVSQITTQAAQIGKALTLGPVTQGFEEYATNLNSIQTILANTKASGANLQDVNEALQQLNTYSDQTIYNFGQMAKSIGLFTAAGVDLDTSVASIKGISNLAALSGSNAQQASTAMYQLSQAIASGRVSLQDWNSVVNAGMGGATFQRALAETAVAMGKIDKSAVTTQGKMKNVRIEGESFRESIMAAPGKQSWLTSEVLTTALKNFTGDMSEADLVAQGFSKNQAKAIMDTAATAKAAATEVKTLKGVFDVAKESIGSGWAQTFQNIFGDFEEAKTTFTGVSQFFGKLISNSADARNQVLSDWKDLGGRAELIEGVKAAFEALSAAIAPIKDAFRDIFPRQTGESLLALTVQFRDLMESLKLSPETADNLRRIFRGLFAVLHIGWEIVKQVTSSFFELLGIVGKGSGGILNFAGSIGDLLVALDHAISRGGALEGVFDGIVAVLQGPMALLKDLAATLASLFVGEDKATGLSEALNNLGNSAGPLAAIADNLAKAWEKVSAIFERIKEILQPVFDKIGEEASRLGDILAKAFETQNFDKILATLQTGFLGGILFMLRRFKNNLNVTLEGGFFSQISTTFKTLTGNLKSMQANLHAKTLLAIAAAIAALAGGVFLLAQIEPKRLASAMTAVSVGLAQLMAAMALLTKAGGPTAFATMPFIAASLIGLATAVTILAAAVKIFSTMTWDELIKGLAGVGGALLAVGLGLKFMGPATLIQGPALIAIGIGLNVIAAAVKSFGDISWENLAKGILGVGLSLTAMAAGLTFMGPSLLLIGPGLIAASFGMNILAGAVSAFGSMDLETLAKGIGGVAAALVAVGLAISFIPPTVALQGAGLIILAAGLTGLSAAIGILGSMSVGKLVKGIVAMGAALVVLGLGLTAMSGTLIGSAALLAAAAAFAILGPALGFMGTLEWGTIVKGLAAIALTLGVLAVAGLVVAGPIAVLSLALGALGIALVLVTTPIYILAKALELLGASGTKGVAVMIAALTAFVLVLPKIVIDFVKGMVSIIGEIAKLAPQVVASIGKILDSILQIVTEAAPKLAVAAGALIVAFLKILNDNAGPFIDAGIKLVTDFLGGISNNVGKVTAQAADIITKFLDSLKGDAPRITQSGVATISAFLLGIANQFPKLVETVAAMIGKFLTAVTSHIPGIIAKGTELIIKFLNGVASKIGDVIAAGVNLILKFLGGIVSAIPRIVNKALDVAEAFVRGVAKGTAKLVDIGFQAVIDFLNGTAKAIRNRGPELRQAGWNVADALIDGIYAGIKELGQKVLDALGDLVKLMPHKVRQLLGIASPSKVFQEIGRFTMAGFAVGIDDGGDAVNSSVRSAANGVISTAKDMLGKVPALLDGMMDLDPVITPVLDLAAVQKEAEKLKDLTNVVPITAAASFGQASAISEEATAASDAAAVAAETKVFQFEQNNYSPEALSDVEIYRKTNNQLSQLRSALGLP